jgi:hypothetical protein
MFTNILELTSPPLRRVIFFLPFFLFFVTLDYFIGFREWFGLSRLRFLSMYRLWLEKIE